MNSILIKGMKMPKGRPLCIVIDATGQARHYDLNNDKYADDELFEAVTVPPHGRLIDADALKVQDGWLRDSKYFSQASSHTHITFVYSNDICNAPTVIEAELPVHHGTFTATSEQEALKRIILSEGEE